VPAARPAVSYAVVEPLVQGLNGSGATTQVER
jgi:hypothetical protein